MENKISNNCALRSVSRTLIQYSSVFLVMVVVVGCSDSNVEMVRNGKLDFDRSITVGQALENRNFCDDIEWSSSQDDKGRVYVDHTCYVYSFNDFFAGHLNAQKNPDRVEEKISFRVIPDDGSFVPSSMTLTAYLDEKEVLNEDRGEHAGAIGRHMQSIYEESYERNDYLDDIWYIRSEHYDVE